MADKTQELIPMEPIVDTTPARQSLVEEGYHFDKQGNLDRRCQSAQKTCFQLIEKLAGHTVDLTDLQEHSIQIGTPPKVGKLIRTREYEPDHEKKVAHNVKILEMEERIDSGEIPCKYHPPSADSTRLTISKLGRELQLLTSDIPIKPVSRLSEIGTNMLQEYKYLYQASNISQIDKANASELIDSLSGIYMYLQDLQDYSPKNSTQK